MPKSKTSVRRGTGNVFRDLGFPVPEAEHLLVRADLMLRLEREISPGDSRGLAPPGSSACLDHE